MPQPRPALLGRQGLAGLAAPGGKAFRPGPFSVSAAAHRHRPQFSRGDRVPRSPRGGARRAADRALGRGFDRARDASSLARSGESRNRHQSVTLLDAIEEFGFDACIGGARRDEEKARAKGARSSRSATPSANGIRRTSGPSSGTSTTRACITGEHVRVFPDQQLDRARRLAVHRARATRGAVDLPRAQAARSCAAAVRWSP